MAAGPRQDRARTPTVRTSINPERGCLLRNPDLEDFRSARRACAFGCRTPIFHGDLLGSFDVALRFALHAIACGHFRNPLQFNTR
jgi:hypothetical protein